MSLPEESLGGLWKAMLQSAQARLLGVLLISWGTPWGIIDQLTHLGLASLGAENLGSEFSRHRHHFGKKKSKEQTQLHFLLFISQVNNARKPEVKVSQQSNTGKSGRLEENSCPPGQLPRVKHGGK